MSPYKAIADSLNPLVNEAVEVTTSQFKYLTRSIVKQISFIPCPAKYVHLQPLQCSIATPWRPFYLLQILQLKSVSDRSILSRIIYRQYCSHSDVSLLSAL